MRVLLDTNVLLRLTDKTHPHQQLALLTLRNLASEGHTFCIGSQSIGEFLAVATRSIQDRGLGMQQATADDELAIVTSALEILYDSAQVMDELRKLVVSQKIIGKSVHDTRLVATMKANGLRRIVTFNSRDFARFREIEVIDPASTKAAAAKQTSSKRGRSPGRVPRDR